MRSGAGETRTVRVADRRTRERCQTDVSSTGPSKLKEILRVDADQFRWCLTEKMLTYALGRGIEYYDYRAVD